MPSSAVFRATVITTYMKNGGKLETAQEIANHESLRTTKLYGGREGRSANAGDFSILNH
jgi:site-specific recombinase XerD